LPLGITSRFETPAWIVLIDIDRAIYRYSEMKFLIVLALCVVAATATENNDPISQESNVEYNGKYHYQ